METFHFRYKYCGDTYSISITCPKGDHIAKCYRSSGTFYELDLLESIAKDGPRGGTWVDIGANIGNHSIFFAKFLADKVICVEANPVAVSLLTKNLVANGVLNNCQIVECALANVDSPNCGKLVQNIPGNIGTTKVVLGNGTIPIRNLDDILQNGDDKVDFVKIDVEGLELDVLMGAKKTLENHHPHLAIELASKEAFCQIEKFLSDFGYHTDGQSYCFTPTYRFWV